MGSCKVTFESYRQFQMVEKFSGFRYGERRGRTKGQSVSTDSRMCSSKYMNTSISVCLMTVIGHTHSYSLSKVDGSAKPVIHFTDKLDILEREKEKAIKICGNQPNGLWWLEFRLD
ncbi:hypothetical protein AVEN_52315-1 [Araneus ventricosus]|uniref:Uncharacterized protein n=1 Tax=Araneus ventricosus TaxID=182803 RepID=A0A4Y2GI50_ARAVE|nr:hypothetical protein AVEN_52315-1 [Araneus ventricosus]